MKSPSVVGVNSNPRFEYMGTAPFQIGFCGPWERFSKGTRLSALPFGLAVTKLSMSALSCLEIRRRALAFGSDLRRQAQKSRSLLGGASEGVPT